MVTRFFGVRRKLIVRRGIAAKPVAFVSFGLKDAAFRTIPRITALIRPECSATPTPNRATRTTPSGAKLVKLLTMFCTIIRNPSALSKLTGRIMPSGARPLDPSGRGSGALQSIHSARPLRSTTPKANSAKRVTGWGRRLPSHSTKSRKRVNRLFFFPFVSGTFGSSDLGYSLIGQCVIGIGKYF